MASASPRVLAFLFFALLASSSARAQLTNATGDVSTPIPGVGHDYIHGISETVNPANGSVSLKIDIPIPPGRGITIPFSIQYNSSGILQPYVVNINNGEQWMAFSNQQTGTGWVYSIPSLTAIGYIATFNDSSVRPPRIESCNWISSYMFQPADASRHRVDISIAQHYYPSGGTYCGAGVAARSDYLTGGDSVYLAATSNPYTTSPVGSPAPVTVAGPDGTVYKFSTFGNTSLGPTQSPGNGGGFYARAASVEDRNGNIVNITTATSGAITETDSVGRTAISVSAINSNQNTVSVSGISTPYSLQWASQNSNFTSSTLEIENPLVGGSCSTGIAANSQALNVVHSIALPNGQSYQFGYDTTYGLLNYIKYPTGATVTYTWGINALSESTYWIPQSSGTPPTCVMEYGVPAITKRVVSFDGVHPAQEQDFSYQTTWTSGVYNWQTKKTIVTTKDLITNASFETIYNYSPLGVGTAPNTSAVYIPPTTPTETLVNYYADLGATTLRTTTKRWLNQYQLACEFTTLDNLGTAATSGTYYAYTTLGSQITDKAEYDFNLVPSSSCTNSLTKPSSPVATRDSAYAYQSFSATPIFPTGPTIFDEPSSVITYGTISGTLTRVAETDYSYDQNTIAAATTPLGTHDETNYAPGSAAPRANLTTITKKCLQSCSDAVTKFYYDETGQVVSKIDPCGNSACSDMSGSNHTTTYSYADSFDSNPSTNTNAYLTQVTSPLGQTVSFKYAYADGQLISSTDQNGLITSYLYNDSLRRLTETDRPDGGKTTVSYSDTAPSSSFTTTKSINSSQSIVSTAVMDGLGHPTQTQLTSDPQGTIYTDTTYNGLALVNSVSNPYRSGTDPTSSPGITKYSYDALARKTLETEPGTDGSQIMTAYCGPSTLVTDPTGKWRRSTTNGLGFLVQVDEPNSSTSSVTACPTSGDSTKTWSTAYGNDVLGDLISVLQNGSHTRSFNYDSLKRLLTSTNPEVGTITYTYDADSNVSTKKDARNITTTYGYDVLSRLTSSSYSNGDPSVTTVYDGTNCLGLSACQNIGQRTSMTDAAGSEIWSYQIDATNHRSLHRDQRTTSGVTKTMTYTLDYAGNTTQATYPTGRVVNYTFDNAGRPSKATDASTGIVYAAAPSTPLTNCPTTYVCYTPQGSVYSISLGQVSSGFTGLNINETFNTRLQPNEIKVSSTGGNALDLSYNYTDPVTLKNAGHVYGTINNLDSSRSQTFTYDQLNRITGALTTSTHATSPTHCWGETYSLDAWANLQSIAATTNSAYTGCSQESGFSTTADGNNHVYGFSYDPSGNTSSDAVNSYAWNAESQLKAAAGVNYLYDGDGRRVAKDGSKLYWYGGGSEILAETDTAGGNINDYIFFGGKRLASLQAGIQNPSFEAGSNNWSLTNGQIITDSTRAHSGNYYVQLTAAVNGGASAIQSSWIRVHPGQVISSFGGWVYPESGSSTHWGWTLEVADANHHGFSYTSLNNGLPIGSWTQQTGSNFTVPAGGYYALMYCQVYLPTASTVLRCDDGFLSANGITYYAEDVLGTSRIATDDSGAVCYDADFYPYGGERPYTNTCSPVYKFEGKERDIETGNDDFGARYYSNLFGRWLSADWSSVPVAVPYANLSNPQTLNLYAMVADDPESFADLDGHTGGDDLSDMISHFFVSAGLSYLSDNFFGAFRPSARSPEEQFGQAVGDFAAQQSGVAEAEAGVAGRGDALVLAVAGQEELAPVVAVGSQIMIVHGAATAAVASVHLAKRATAPGSRPGQDFTPAGKREIDARDANQCQKCGRNVKSQQNKTGQPTPPDQRQRHHIKPKKELGSGTPENGETLCPGCHKQKHHKEGQVQMPRAPGTTE